MMMFTTIDETTAVATNSLREVRIVRSVTSEFDRNEWMVYTPNGRLDDDVKVAGPFDSFNRAQRDAECTVGMTIKWRDF
jgi:hypothetical protein